MRRCRKCNQEWDDSVSVCPNDGYSFTVGMDATVGPGGGASAAMAVAPAPVVDEPPPTTDLIPGAIVGEYKVDKKIGEGGMGAVYSATHPMIGKRAAIKVISAALGTDASAVGRFVQEARSVNQIGHPNIVDVFAFGELPDGRNYFVMEYLQGESLADRIQRIAMPLGEAIEILDQVADALEAAHEKQIVHRDLKPDNVYLASVRGGRTMVKLLDFGIAKLSTPDSPGSGGGIAKTRTGMMMGTPGYLSPEQARGKNVDHRTDIYALGCMTFEIACGRLPFVADNAMDIVLMHMTTPPVRASSVWPEIPAPLDDLIARMLEKEASARPSLQEVRAVFSELVSSGLVTLNNGRGIAFGSGIARMQTPAGGMPKQPTVNLAAGTQPAQPRPPTEPPLTAATAVGAAPTIAPTTPAPTAKSKAPIFAAIAGVLVLGAAGAFFALKGGGEDKKPTPAAGSDTVAAVEPPKVEEPKVEPPKVEPPKVEEPKTVVPEVKPSTIEVTFNVDGASVTVDGEAATITGKTAKATVKTEGPHKILVSAKGREPFETTVETKSGDSMKVVAQLEKTKAGAKKPPTGTTATNTTGTKPPPTGTGSGTKPAGTGSGAKPVDNTNGTVDPFAD